MRLLVDEGTQERADIKGALRSDVSENGIELVVGITSLFMIENYARKCIVFTWSE